MLVLTHIFSITNLVETIITWGIAVAGVVGALWCALTRPDAFIAADRYPKFAWAGFLLLSAVLQIVSFYSFWIFGAVVIGVFWFDVFPQLRRIMGRSR